MYIHGILNDDRVVIFRMFVIVNSMVMVGFASSVLYVAKRI